MNEEELIYTYEELENLVLKYQELYIKEKNNINKAIEYIEKNSDDMHTYISQILTDILKGVEE